MLTRQVVPIVTAMLTAWVLGPGQALANEPNAEGPHAEETALARVTLTAPVNVTAGGRTELVAQRITFPAGTSSGWHTNAGTAVVAVTKGTLTLHRAAGGGCNAATHSPGSGFVVGPGEVHLAANGGSAPVEIEVVHLAHPDGAPLEAHADQPAGATCPVTAAGSEAGIAATEVARADVPAPVTIEAADNTELVLVRYTIEPGATLAWHRSAAATAVAVTKGVFSLQRASVAGCAPVPIPAREGTLIPAGEVHQGRVGAQPVELYVAFVGVPAGSAIEEDAPAPADCPAAAGELARTGAQATGLAWSGAALAVMGLALSRLRRR